MEEYKEHGLEFRHHDTQISAANRLMLPPLVIGLLVLYGEVDKFLGVEFKNPEAAHLLIWSGCLIISLIWVFNVSRTAQLVHSHLDTRRKNAEIFGLRGHTKIYKMDKDSDVSKIFRHNKLRLVGFWIYLCLLLLKVESLHFHGVLSFLNSIEWWFILGIVSIVSAYLSGWIWYIYFKAPLRSSRATPTKLLAIIKQKFHDIKKMDIPGDSDETPSHHKTEIPDETPSHHKTEIPRHQEMDIPGEYNEMDIPVYHETDIPVYHPYHHIPWSFRTSDSYVCRSTGTT